LVFDGVLLLQHLPILPTKAEAKNVSRTQVPWIKDSFTEIAMSTCLTDTQFLKKLLTFSADDKDNINDETCELLEPYLREEDYFNPNVAKNASSAAQGLCTWVGAMVMYHEAAKIVKPKMDFLAIQRGRLEEAQKQYGFAQAQLKEAEDTLAGLQATFDKALAEKNLLVENATKT
jgi:dynein heavy chain